MSTWHPYTVNITLDKEGDVYKSKDTYKLVNGKDRANLFKNNNLYSFHIKGINSKNIPSNSELFYLTQEATVMKIWVQVDHNEEPIIKNNLIQARKYEI